MNDDIYNSKVMIEVKPDDYYNDFRNTNNLPLTSIYNLIEDDYPAFLSDPDNKNILLTSVFDFNYKGFLFSSKGNFNGNNIKNNSTFSLEKLITYLIYTKSSYLLEEKNGFFHLNIPGLKSQVGKDISRLTVLINNQTQNFSSLLHGGDPDPDSTLNASTLNASTLNASTLNASTLNASTLNASTLNDNNNFVKETNYDEITDNYNEILINQDPGKVVDNIKLINFNNISKIDILSCQSIFNFIAELIQIQIKNIAQSTLNDNYLLISPTSREDSNGISTLSNDKELRIILDKQSRIVTIYFDSYLFTSLDFVAVGKVSFELSLDLMNNSFQFDTLNIEYNLEAYKPKYTMAQTAKYYGITKPTRYIQKRLTRKGGRKGKSKGQSKSMKMKKERKAMKTKKEKKVMKTKKGKKAMKGRKSKSHF